MPTLKETRRALSTAMREPFFLDIPEGEINPESGSTTTVIKTNYTALWTYDNMWKGAWAYFFNGANGGKERRIVAYDATTGDITIAPALPTPPATTDGIEIHSRTPARAKNDAINRAIRVGWPHFYQVETLTVVIPKNVTVLDANTLDNWPTDWYQLLTADLEPYRPFLTGELTPNVAEDDHITLRLEFPDVSWDEDQFVGDTLAVIDGPGVGYEATITDSDENSIYVASDDFPTPPDEESTVVVKSGTPLTRWRGIDNLWPQGDKNVQRILLPGQLTRQPGRALRLRGIKPPAELSTDFDTTDIPLDYLVAAAAGYLPLRSTYDAESITVNHLQWIGRWDTQDAKDLAAQYGWSWPEFTVWKPDSRRPGKIVTPFS